VLKNAKCITAEIRKVTMKGMCGYSCEAWMDEIHDIYFLLEVTSVLVRYPLERSSPSLFPLKLARF
jgi:hypothetical protein